MRLFYAARLFKLKIMSQWLDKIDTWVSEVIARFMW